MWIDDECFTPDLEEENRMERTNTCSNCGCKFTGDTCPNCEESWGAGYLKKPKVKKICTITEKTPHIMDEWYCMWYTCSNPKCQKQWIAQNFSYCPNCGYKIERI